MRTFIYRILKTKFQIDIWDKNRTQMTRMEQMITDCL